jgi:hypothetical protein
LRGSLAAGADIPAAQQTFVRWHNKVVLGQIRRLLLVEVAGAVSFTESRIYIF